MNPKEDPMTVTAPDPGLAAPLGPYDAKHRVLVRLPDGRTARLVYADPSSRGKSGNVVLPSGAHLRVRLADLARLEAPPTEDTAWWPVIGGVEFRLSAAGTAGRRQVQAREAGKPAARWQDTALTDSHLADHARRARRPQPKANDLHWCAVAYALGIDPDRPEG